MKHQTEVNFQPAYGEWLPSCLCGWTGSYDADVSRAIAEADAHESEETGR